MAEKNIKKTKQNLYVPEFIAEILAQEAEIRGGPGGVLATAIFSFFLLSEAEKKQAKKAYNSAMLDIKYDTESVTDVLVNKLKSVHGSRKARRKKVTPAKHA